MCLNKPNHSDTSAAAALAKEAATLDGRPPRSAFERANAALAHAEHGQPKLTRRINRLQPPEPYDPNRGSGRTLRLALLMLAEAIGNPDFEAVGQDHVGASTAGQMALLNTLQRLEGLLKLRYIVIRPLPNYSVGVTSHIFR